MTTTCTCECHRDPAARLGAVLIFGRPGRPAADRDQRSILEHTGPLWHGEPARCADCGHVHTGPALAGICIGCPCERRP